MSAPALDPTTFAYRARGPDGKPLTGTIDATDVDAARQRLLGLSLTVEGLSPARRPAPARPLSKDEFLAFNQQLAQLTAAGMPVEHGLRLVAQEVRRGKMKQTIDAVVAELEKGKSLSQALEAHRKQFPPLYSRMVEAGIRSGNLSAVLLNLGRHLTLMRRLQAALWRTFAYPIAVLVIFVAVLGFVMTQLLPQFAQIMKAYDAMPWGFYRRHNTSIGSYAEAGAWTLVGLLLIIAIFCWVAVTLIGRKRIFAEHLLLRLPLLGPIFRRNLIARWCDAVALGVEAGMDLPAAVSLAQDAIISPGLQADGRSIVDALSAGRTVTQTAAMRVLTPMVPAALELSSQRSNLGQALQSLSQLYQQQAELRLRAVQATLTPIIVVAMGAAVALLALAILMPMFQLI